MIILCLSKYDSEVVDMIIHILTIAVKTNLISCFKKKFSDNDYDVNVNIKNESENDDAMDDFDIYDVTEWFDTMVESIKQKKS